ncbi:MAG: hypothetical protein LBE83_10060, partial [Propionibacteriaceae bacterium]|nr:hypothetical protein [Propionibacteriaceae bacterium]
VIIPLSVSPQILAVLKPGDHVSIFLSSSSNAEVTIARGIRIVTIPASDSGGLFGSGGGNLILVEVPEALAAQITASGGLGSTTIALE